MAGSYTVSQRVDITPSVRFGNNDDELLPITRCMCGATFPSWEFTISIYPDNPSECPNCGRRMYFENKIVVWEVEP